MRSGSVENTSDKEHHSDGPINVCRFFASGKFCKYGKRCRFLHEKNEDGILNNPSKESRPTSSEGQGVQEANIQDDRVKHNEELAETLICKYFVAHGHCRYGRSCKFSHAVQNEHFRQAGRRPGQNRTTQNVCRFFQQGYCRFGNYCNNRHVYYHQPSKPPRSNAVHASSKTKAETPKSKTISSSVEFPVEDLTDELIQDFRIREIEQLFKRYPAAEAQDDCVNGDAYSFTFVPTDPDWPYDVKEVKLNARFPDQYPKSRLKVSVVESNIIPQVVRDEVAYKVRNWLRERRTKFAEAKRVELVFRALLRWLDRSLEDIFTEGLKNYKRQLAAEAAKVQFVSASELQNQVTDEDSDDENADEENGDYYDEHADEENGDYYDEHAELGPNEETEAETEVVIVDEQPPGDEQSQEVTKSTADTKMQLDTPRRGTEVKLNNLQLGENIACMFAHKIGLIIQCIRCKSKMDVKVTNNKLYSVACSQCHTDQMIRWRGTLVHSMTSILGYLDLTDCVAFDMILLDLSYTLTCLECNHEMTLEGLSNDKPKHTWCRHCHKKLTLAMQSVKFLQLQPVEIGKDQQAEVIQLGKIKKVRDPVIQAGCPLPEFGTCRHYKKSYRWLRFPCCGKAYPCDLCHEEKTLDHEMKYANRMICGHCAKEQPYSTQGPCVSCLSSMTKRITAHWEGGKGCRDKTRMSKTDPKKYSNCNKTVSKKAQPAKDKANKK